MFDFVGTFFQKVGTTIGGALITIGGFFGGSAPVDTQAPIPVDSVPEFQEATDKSDKTIALVATKTQSYSVETKAQVSAVTKSALQIEDVESVAEGVQATVTWTTTLPSESRLIFDNGEGKVFESESGLSTMHKIQASGLGESREYDYKITATTEDKAQNDDYFGTIFAPKKFTGSLGAVDDECQEIIIKDTAGHVATGKKISVRGYHYNDEGQPTPYGKPTLSLTTDAEGKVEYCEGANTFKISGEELNVTLSSFVETPDAGEQKTFLLTPQP